MDSANDGELEELKAKYEEAADIKEKQFFLSYKNKTAGSSALHLAANKGHVEIVEYICECITRDFPARKHMIVNATNKYKFTPLINSCFRGYMTKG